MTADLRLLASINKSLARAPHVSLDPDEIEAYVARKTGVSRVPGVHWRPALHTLCTDLEQSADLNPLGRIMANGQLVGLLRARVRAERLLARYPEIHEVPATAPIIILGPMRSGSTRVQRLLACDDRLSCTKLFETLFPVPARRPDRSRVAKAALVHTTLRMLNPAVQQVHPAGPLRPEEEFGYLSFAFHSGQFAVQWPVPRLLAQESKRDLEPVVSELKTLLQINAWARGDRKGQRRVLKCPAYSDLVEPLLKVFPDAKLICLSRDPLKVVASSASLVFEQRRIHSDGVHPLQLGPEWLGRTVERQRKVAAARTRNPQVPAFDLHYGEMNADWIGAMHRLYRFLGLPLTKKVLAAMTRFERKARAHEGHRYSLEQFGLSEAEVLQAFSGECCLDLPGPAGRSGLQAGEKAFGLGADLRLGRVAEAVPGGIRLP